MPAFILDPAARLGHAERGDQEVGRDMSVRLYSVHWKWVLPPIPTSLRHVSLSSIHPPLQLLFLLVILQSRSLQPRF